MFRPTTGSFEGGQNSLEKQMGPPQHPAHTLPVLGF